MFFYKKKSQEGPPSWRRTKAPPAKEAAGFGDHNVAGGFEGLSRYYI
jgi:hypothetical protein